MARFNINLNKADFDKDISMYDLMLPKGYGFRSRIFKAQLVTIDLILDRHSFICQVINYEPPKNDKNSCQAEFVCKERLANGELKPVMSKTTSGHIREKFLIKGSLDVMLLGHHIRVAVIPGDGMYCRVTINKLD